MRLFPLQGCASLGELVGGCPSVTCESWRRSRAGRGVASVVSRRLVCASELFSLTLCGRLVAVEHHRTPQPRSAERRDNRRSAKSTCFRQGRGQRARQARRPEDVWCSRTHSRGSLANVALGHRCLRAPDMVVSHTLPGIMNWTGRWSYSASREWASRVSCCATSTRPFKRTIRARLAPPSWRKRLLSTMRP